MTTARKLAIGLLMGLALSLLLHPVSRGLIFDGFCWGPWRALNQTDLVRPIDRSKHPKTNLQRWRWIHTGMSKIQGRQKLTRIEVQTLLQITNESIRAEPENAFWHQVKAVMLRAAGNRNAMVAELKAAARKDRWINPQDEGVIATVNRLGGDLPRAWQIGAIMSQRSTITEAAFEALCRDVVRSTQRSGTDIDVRLAVMQNGILIARDAKSIDDGDSGARIVEMASFPSDVPIVTSPRKLTIARTEFVTQLKEMGRNIDAEVADRAFRSNDGRAAFSDRSEARMAVSEYLLWATIAATVPGSCLWVATIGFFVWLAGKYLEKLPAVLLHPYTVLMFGFLAAIMAGLLSGQIIVGLSTVLSFGLLALPQDSVRTRAKPNLAEGPSSVITVLAIALSLLWIFYIGGILTACWEIGPKIEWPHEYIKGSTIFIGQIIIASNVVILLAPVLAWAYRMQSLPLLWLLMRTLGSRMAAVSFAILLLSIVPLAQKHRYSLDSLREVMLNEPVHFLGRRAER